jgi:Na+/proline symporter
MVAPIVAGTVLGQAGAVLVFVVVFASIASSIDSLLAATSDLVTKELVQPSLGPDVSPERLRRIASRVVLGLGVLTWVACLPKVGTLATVLFFAGPLVASTIWPILLGLYWPHASRIGAVLAMTSGTVVGLAVYFMVGWYAGSLAAALVSCVVSLGAARFAPDDFDWDHLARGRVA